MSDRKPTPNILDDVLSGAAAGPAAPAPGRIAIGVIRADGGTQMRAGLDPATVQEYADVLYVQERVSAWPFPPIVVYHDGTAYWLADGFHRVAAVRKLLPGDDVYEIPAEVRAGSRRDAVLYAAGANASHGLRRANADKRRAVEVLLRDEEWQKWSDSEIARRCAVDHKTVSNLRSILGNSQDRPTERTVTRGGTTYTQKTANIGANRPAYATVFAIEQIVKPEAQRYFQGMDSAMAAKELRQVANTTSGPFWEACWKAFPRDMAWRKSDLRQAIRNVASQLEAAATPKPAPAPPAAPGAWRPPHLRAESAAGRPGTLDVTVRAVTAELYPMNDDFSVDMASSDMLNSLRSKRGDFYTALKQRLAKTQATYTPAELQAAVDVVAAEYAREANRRADALEARLMAQYGYGQQGRATPPAPAADAQPKKYYRTFEEIMAEREAQARQAAPPAPAAPRPITETYPTSEGEGDAAPAGKRLVDYTDEDWEGARRAADLAVLVDTFTQARAALPAVADLADGRTIAAVATPVLDKILLILAKATGGA